MKILTRLLSLAAAVAIAWPATQAKPTPSILAIKDTIHDNSVIIPESFETDVKKMQENWYLKNYAQLDRNADSRPSPVTTDQDYIDRLALLPTVIDMPYNSVVKNFIVMYSERKRQLVENMLGMSLYYMPIFEEALERYGLPLELRYLPVIESALNPAAVSRAGAAGLWQFMPGTATQMGLELNSLVDMRRDPIASSDAAARYLKQLYGIFGDWSLAIASYNCGPGNVAKAIRRAGGGKKDFWEIYPFLPAETRGYVPAFIAANYVMNNYDKHNISPALARKPILTDTVHISRRIHFRQISDVLAIPMDELRALNPQFRTDLIPGDIRPYALVLPSLQTFAYIANEDSIANHNATLYARRNIVEPANGSVQGSDNKGRYVDDEGKIHVLTRQSTSYTNTGLEVSTDYYLVNADGNIEFPIIGPLHVAGLTKNQVAEVVVNAIYPHYVTERPNVDIRLMNFRVSVAGAVKNPGVYQSRNERMTFLEAISMAGDLDIKGDRENVLLYRTNSDGSREVHRINLQDRNFLMSPYFTLQQNDFIYVTPNKSMANQAWQMAPGVQSTITIVGGISSLASLVIGVLNLTKK